MFAFFMKIDSDNANIAKLLVESGSNVNVADKDGNTALHLATRYGKFIVLFIQ